MYVSLVYIIFLLEDITSQLFTEFVDLTQQTQDLLALSQHDAAETIVYTIAEMLSYTNYTGPPAVFLNVIVNIILN